MLQCKMFLKRWILQGGDQKAGKEVGKEGKGRMVSQIQREKLWIILLRGQICFAHTHTHTHTHRHTHTHTHTQSLIAQAWLGSLLGKPQLILFQRRWCSVPPLTTAAILIQALLIRWNDGYKVLDTCRHSKMVHCSSPNAPDIRRQLWQQRTSILAEKKIWNFSNLLNVSTVLQANYYYFHCAGVEILTQRG